MSAPGQPTPGRVILLMLGSAAITVAVLLPLYLLDRQATRLAIAKLEIELAHARASASAAPATSTPVALAPASPAAPAPSALPPATVAPVPSSRAAEMVQVTRALTDLARRVDGLATPGDTLRSAPPRSVEEPSAQAPAARPPVNARDVDPAPPPVRLTDVRIKVFYESRCLGLAVEVAERLLALGADPELIETRQTLAGMSRLTYMGSDQAPIAVAIADGLSATIPVDVQPDTSGVAAGGPRLQLAGAPACQRAR